MSGVLALLDLPIPKHLPPFPAFGKRASIVLLGRVHLLVYSPLPISTALAI